MKEMNVLFEEIIKIISPMSFILSLFLLTFSLKLTSKVFMIFLYDDGYPLFPGSEKIKEKKEDVLKNLKLEDRGE